MINKSEFILLTENMDFDLIQKKIVKKDPNIARLWTKKGAKDAIEQYKKFMYLLYKYHNTEYQIVPSIEVDEIWHHHILDTRKYSEDCKKIYGFFMHHFPYFGRWNKKDQRELEKAFVITQKLYFEEFGEYMYEVDF
jgi:hypothetical protein